MEVFFLEELIPQHFKFPAQLAVAEFGVFINTHFISAMHLSFGKQRTMFQMSHVFPFSNQQFLVNIILNFRFFKENKKKSQDWVRFCMVLFHCKRFAHLYSVVLGEPAVRG